MLAKTAEGNFVYWLPVEHPASQARLRYIRREWHTHWVTVRRFI